MPNSRSCQIQVTIKIKISFQDPGSRQALLNNFYNVYDKIKPFQRNINMNQQLWGEIIIPHNGKDCKCDDIGYLSLLNDNLKKNFSTFINEFRIDCAKRKIIATSNITLEEIGYECGFNSKSTFYTTFKKLVGKTPAQFKSANL